MTVILTVCDVAVVQTTLVDGNLDAMMEHEKIVSTYMGIGDEHLDLLSKIGEALEDEEVLEKMKTTEDVAWILEQLA